MTKTHGLTCDWCDNYASLKAVNMFSGNAKMLCAECLEEITCPNCGAVEGTEEWGTVGDGFDGYCPGCADERE